MLKTRFAYQVPIIPRVVLGFEDFDLVVRCEDSENAPYYHQSHLSIVIPKKKIATRARILRPLGAEPDH